MDGEYPNPDEIKLIQFTRDLDRMSKCNMYCVPHGDELATNEDADAETAYITFAQAARACPPKRIEKIWNPTRVAFQPFLN